jgi:hypothetical protein
MDQHSAWVAPDETSPQVGSPCMAASAVTSLDGFRVGTFVNLRWHHPIYAWMHWHEF